MYIPNISTNTAQYWDKLAMGPKSEQISRKLGYFEAN